MFRNGLEPWHILVMVAVLVLLFGSKKLPEMARGLGKSMRILKAETKALREDDAQAEGQNTTASSTAADQPRPAVSPTSVTTSAETTKSATNA
ncbi:Sec-independent protein translocase subunit TatA [Kitasatospora sp. DSM 101779]|uniref:Sec-independent protein translocase subunit TatA n=1 Tax=Kitasatospora sp. DSM 101779 TaxID=2853165 RepID=UPI0021D9D4C8|nr:Sec-independent protein translocase subunit TatA [Kitasatospora sp. DSM 101779]MCU7824022.1 Sec-independent protein translocase subunit TatA [Kitasatospora sp. DSM 101779]